MAIAFFSAKGYASADFGLYREIHMQLSIGSRTAVLGRGLRRLVVPLVGAAGMSACGIPQRHVRMSPHEQSASKQNAVAFSTPADLRLAFLREGDAMSVYCAEPMPDVALGSEQTGSGSLSAANAATQAASAAVNAALSQENDALRKDLRDVIAHEDSTKNEYTRSHASSSALSSSVNESLNLQAAYKLAVTVAELGGRSQQVLLAREFLYRICEARANRFFVDPNAYVTLQTNALRLIQSISTPVRPTETSERAEFLRRAAEYTAAQQSLCQAKQNACTAVAADDAAKKECGKACVRCLDAVDHVVTPKASEGTESTPPAQFELVIPGIKTTEK